MFPWNDLLLGPRRARAFPKWFYNRKNAFPWECLVMIISRLFVAIPMIHFKTGIDQESRDDYCSNLVVELFSNDSEAISYMFIISGDIIISFQLNINRRWSVVFPPIKPKMMRPQLKSWSNVIRSMVPSSPIYRMMGCRLSCNILINTKKSNNLGIFPSRFHSQFSLQFSKATSLTTISFGIRHLWLSHFNINFIELVYFVQMDSKLFVHILLFTLDIDIKSRQLKLWPWYFSV